MTNFKESPQNSQFGRRENSKVKHTPLHRLPDILNMFVCKVICGVGRWVEAADFCPTKREGRERVLDLASAIPVYDTFGRICVRLEV